MNDAMRLLKKVSSWSFLILAILVLWQCAQRGTPSGGPEDVTPPRLLRTDPPNLSTNFKAKKIRLYFDEFIKLNDVANQLIVSPPLKYTPTLKPQGGTSKFIEVTFKDTLRENTTYTINFGQSIVDNNEGNPNSFLSYVFSTGDYIDSLSLTGAIKDAFNKTAEQFVSVMLYEIDSIYNDSTIYKYPPNYITNTLDSLPLFTLSNLKAGDYALFGIKDQGKNNVFDQRSDKIAFLTDTITLPSDSLYLLNLFLEEPDYSVSVPSFVSQNRILFGYNGNGKDIEIKSLTPLPDSVRTLLLKERDKDTLNFWLTPTDIDSLVFTITNDRLQVKDTFTVKTRKLPADSLMLSPSHRGKFGFEDTFEILANTPLTALDTTRIGLLDQDTLRIAYKARLDTVDNKITFDFEVEPNQEYTMVLLPGAITDFFEQQNDTTDYGLRTGSYADYANLELTLNGNLEYPIIVQLTDNNGEVLREISSSIPQAYTFNNLEPKEYGIRVIFDQNNNGKWDTGNYLKKRQPEAIKYYPDLINLRANWEERATFTIAN